MQAGARAACASPPLSSPPTILFSIRRALMFLFEKRAFLPACGPLPFAYCLLLDKPPSLTRCMRYPSPQSAYVSTPYLGDESPPCG